MFLPFVVVVFITEPELSTKVCREPATQRKNGEGGAYRQGVPAVQVDTGRFDEPCAGFMKNEAAEGVRINGSGEGGRPARRKVLGRARCAQKSFSWSGWVGMLPLATLYKVTLTRWNELPLSVVCCWTLIGSERVSTPVARLR